MALWNNVNTAAWNAGTLVYAMDQSLTPGFAAMPAGYCMGLATVWLHYRTMIWDYDHDSTSMELLGTGQKPIEVQKIYDQTLASSGGDLWKSTEAAIAKVGMKPFKGRWHDTNVNSISASGLYSAINSSGTGGNGYYIVGMANKWGDAHAIAIVNEPDSCWRLFDANYGHFRMKGNNLFTSFLGDYLRASGTGYAVRYNERFTTMGLQPWYS